MKKEKSVRSIIKDLEVGQAADFPRERYDYIVSCTQRLKVSTGYKLSTSTSETKVIVTRS